MAHYAKINSDNEVTQVFVGVDEDDLSGLPEGYSSWEEWYGRKGTHTVKRTSYNTLYGQHNDGGTPFRGNFAGAGFVYDPDNDVFYLKKPHPSWILNTTIWDWEAPVALPDTTNVYIWDEDLYQSDNTLGWRLTEQISE